MRHSNSTILNCPACRKKFGINIISEQDNSIESAFLKCPSCCVTVPVIHGFPVLDEQMLVQSEGPESIANRLFGTPEEYLSFLDLKRKKPVYDLYAAFQPFNESTQAIFPLIPLLRKVLRPGDFILDLWCRTGWSGELLAALFPEQQIISLWEGHSGVLGLKGFHFWLGTNKRQINLDVIFYSPNNPLPFPADTFSVVHGLDTLHRYHHIPLVAECLRVVKKDGVIVFPHIHLTNSEPEPFFDRGETMHHGMEYRKYFDALLTDTNRKAFVLSEKTLFDAGQRYVLNDEADTQHYNACIVICDKSYEGEEFRRVEKTIDSFRDAYVIVNPLWNIDLTARRALPAPEAMEGGGETLFYRHPIYHNRLKSYAPVPLNESETVILYWALRLKTVSQISDILQIELSQLFEIVKQLESKEVVQMQNVSRAMAKLQHYYCHQQVIAENGESTLTELWNKTVMLHANKPFVIWPEDDSVFSYKDADTIIRMAASFLREHGVQPGDRVLLESILHPEFIFIFWAAVLLGAVAVPISSGIKEESLSSILIKTRPKIILTNSPDRAEIFLRKDAQVFYYAVTEESLHYSGSFSELLGDYPAYAGDFPPAKDEQWAVVLFTSGSTGTPKGVILSHGSLFRSGRIMDQAYQWRSEDRLLSAGSFHTMSGLRNPCIAALNSGISAVIPSKRQSQDPLNLMNLCVEHGVTILNVTPNFLAYWNPAEGKSKYFHSHQLRMILSTGSSLHSSHSEHFEKTFSCPVYDYYGLTETTGACILVNQEMAGLTEKGIGRPFECLIKITDAHGSSLPAGKVGELAIYSQNLMRGYLNDESLTKNRIRNGWFYTGDTAKLNDSGCIMLVGRQDRMMIDKNGENVYPEEIEKAISEADGVLEAYVTQYQDHLFINQIAAVVAVHESGKKMETIFRLRSALSQKIPPQHIPSLIVLVDTIPKGASGKVSPQVVQQLIAAEVNAK